ncbi:MAG TPA: MBL fold metallo-hydrolase [Bryobacteraceae bacterium]|nr:MBL fold metallo-hydrolase [Bryobacteraceae bacterium]
MIRPVLKDEYFLADVRAANRDDDNFRLWWLGQSGFLVQWKGHHLLLDPYLSDSLTKKYAATDKPHVRMTERVVDPARLDFIDVVTSSHNHTDHLDGETLGPLLRVNPGIKMVAPEANRDFIANRLGVDRSFPVGLRDGESATVGVFRFTAVPAAHEEVSPECLGYVVEFGRWRIYHSGDTLLYEGMAERLRPFAVDVALVPINGRAPERRVAGNLDGPEAARLAKEMGARLAIPCHYEMFAFNTALPDEFIRVAESIGQAYRVLRCGERWESTGLAEGA